MKRRIVVTGLGVVSSIGIGWRPFWEALLQGRSGINEVESFDTSEFATHRGGEVSDFEPAAFISEPRVRKYNRASQSAIAAARMALADAGMKSDDVSSKRVGVVIGTTMAEVQAIEAMDQIWVERGEQQIHPRLVSQYPSNMIAAHVGLELCCRGPNMVIATACAAGNYALSYALDALRLGKADAMVVGGADAFSRIAFMGFNRLLAMAPERCQPFDKNRKGMMVGEGAGILVLETKGHADSRQAHIYAEILGYGLSCDANHMTIPETNGISRVMRRALQDSEIEPEDVDYISAHGTGTPANDRTECSAIQEVFGGKSSRIPISSIKSMLGHTMGAASALEAIACVLAVQSDKAPPTINFETPDPECPVDCVPNVGRSLKVGVALNNSFAFGGNNACVAFGKVRKT